jgi:hypothetical protein
MLIYVKYFHAQHYNIYTIILHNCFLFMLVFTLKPNPFAIHNNCSFVYNPVALNSGFILLYNKNTNITNKSLVNQFIMKNDF